MHSCQLKIKTLSHAHIRFTYGFMLSPLNKISSFYPIPRHGRDLPRKMGFNNSYFFSHYPILRPLQNQKLEKDGYLGRDHANGVARPPPHAPKASQRSWRWQPWPNIDNRKKNKKIKNHSFQRKSNIQPKKKQRRNRRRKAKTPLDRTPWNALREEQRSSPSRRPRSTLSPWHKPSVPHKANIFIRLEILKSEICSSNRALTMRYRSTRRGASLRCSSWYRWRRWRSCRRRCRRDGSRSRGWRWRSIRRWHQHRRSRRSSSKPWKP